MILPLAASVALATAPGASAATPTGAAFTQSVRTDDHNGDRHGGGGGSYDRGRHGYGGYDQGRHGYGGYDRGRYGYGYGWISCYNPYLGWHRHSRWDRLHRWDRCNYGRYDGGYRR